MRMRANARPTIKATRTTRQCGGYVNPSTVLGTGGPKKGKRPAGPYQLQRTGTIARRLKIRHKKGS